MKRYIVLLLAACALALGVAFAQSGGTSGGSGGAVSGGVSGGISGGAPAVPSGGAASGGAGSLVINDVTVSFTKADVPASNGLIDVIDTMLLPADAQDTLSEVSGGASGGVISGGASGGAASSGGSSGDLAAVLSADPDLSTFVKALKTAGLYQNLRNPNRPYTVLAPTNAAFDKLPKAQLQALMNDHDTLVEVLQYHLIAGTYTLQRLSGLAAVLTVSGKTLTLTLAKSGGSSGGTSGGVSGGAASGGTSGGVSGGVSGGSGG